RDDREGRSRAQDSVRDGAHLAVATQGGHDGCALRGRPASQSLRVGAVLADLDAMLDAEGPQQRVDLRDELGALAPTRGRVGDDPDHGEADAEAVGLAELVAGVAGAEGVADGRPGVTGTLAETVCGMSSRVRIDRTFRYPWSKRFAACWVSAVAWSITAF